MESAIYDVTLAVPSHGIHNPVNLHSCRPHPCYIPSECAACKYVIFPLTASATCMRCSQNYHRECVKSIKNICGNFIMKEKQLTASSIGTVGAAAARTEDGEGDGDSCVAGSGPPIWSDILVAVSSKYKIATIEMADHTHLKMHDLVLTLLEDSSKFPAAVSSTIRHLYLRYPFKSDHATVVQGRLGLDQIASSIFCVLPTEIASDFEEMKSIINLTDRYTLSKNDNSMYEKIMVAATALASKSDEAIFHHLNKEYSEPIDDSTCGPAVTDAFFKVLTAVTAMDKLTALSHALRVCVAEDSQSPTARVPGQEIARKKSGCFLELTPHGADALIERLTSVICFLSKRYKLRWHAQCTFIELMCPDTSWLFGAEGYSLVTLQQVLSSLLPVSAVPIPIDADVLLASVSSSSHGGLPGSAGAGGRHLDVLRAASQDPGTE